MNNCYQYLRDRINYIYYVRNLYYKNDILRGNEQNISA
ncbi:hypothetical protein A1OE_880 [Candidatus Endolissoclinum faulkneri L2]|uniref:Uncharacterized protein n=1 Tax=Candidatus Endolissoclinum faulkneri L2 TaxID=1193729 RepID=K7YRA2_9PROT|nr:hypothetical protein A1OE_880 [Candidatus Endolissoclinum faulkneri L2]